MLDRDRDGGWWDALGIDARETIVSIIDGLELILRAHLEDADPEGWAKFYAEEGEECEDRA